MRGMFFVDAAHLLMHVRDSVGRKQIMHRPVHVQEEVARANYGCELHFAVTQLRRT